MRWQLLVSGLLLALLVPAGAADVSIARVPVDTDNPDVKAYLETMRAEKRPLINLLQVSALSPPLAKARSAFAFAVRQSVLPRALRELVIVRTAQIMGGHYELNQHVRPAIACGYTQAQIDALPNAQSRASFSEKERALLAYLDQIIRIGATADDAVFAALAKHFSPREIVEITMIASAYMGTAMMTNALGLKVDDPSMLAAVSSGPCG